MRLNCSGAACGDDAAPRDFVFTHEVDGELRAVDDTLVVDIGANQVGLRRDPLREVVSMSFLGVHAEQVCR